MAEQPCLDWPINALFTLAFGSRGLRLPFKSARQDAEVDFSKTKHRREGMRWRLLRQIPRTQTLSAFCNLGGNFGKIVCLPARQQRPLKLAFSLQPPNGLFAKRVRSKDGYMRKAPTLLQP